MSKLIEKMHGFISEPSIPFHWSVSLSNTIQFWLLLLCSDFWNWRLWILQLCSFSRLFCLFPQDSIWILGWAFLFLQKSHWDFSSNYIWTCRLLWVVFTQHFECTKCHRIVHFKKVNYMLCEFQLDLKKKKIRFGNYTWKAGLGAAWGSWKVKAAVIRGRTVGVGDLNTEYFGYLRAPGGEQ